MKTTVWPVMAAIVALGSFASVAGIPYPAALEEASVTLSDMSDGQKNALMLGNGDLYGIVWDREGELFLRMTKNDIWDARVDT